MARLIELQEKTGDAEEMSIIERQNALNELFKTQTIPFYVDLQEATIQAMSDDIFLKGHTDYLERRVQY